MEMLSPSAYQLSQPLIKAFNLNREIIDLSEEELQLLDDYINANLVILKCKESAVRVSRQTWATIEDRMLRVPGDG